jgi:uncharacterized membrane protein YtjA (UPF0391 family)
MLNWSLTFLVVGLTAAILGSIGLAGDASQIGWITFLVFLVLYFVGLVARQRMSWWVGKYSRHRKQMSN